MHRNRQSGNGKGPTETLKRQRILLYEQILVVCLPNRMPTNVFGKIKFLHCLAINHSNLHTKFKMAKGEKERPKIDENDVEEEVEKDLNLAMEGNDGGDEDADREANEDPSLKILDKALLMDQNENDDALVVISDDDVPEVASGVVSVSGGDGGGNSQVIELASSSSTETEAVVSGTSAVKKRKQKKIKRMDIEDKSEEENQEKIRTLEAVKAAEELPESMVPNGVEISDNIVLRKLLRGPRYFDPPDNGWSTCYNCGEEGHMAVNCPSLQKKKKPCFVCGSLEHEAKECKKGRVCFICRKGGHQAKDCPERKKENINGSRKCLKCGDSRHDMFSCLNSYPLDDLKEIQCYICRGIGHLCCADFVDDGARELSCYKCGALGHHAVGGARLCTSDLADPTLWEPSAACSGLHEETNNAATPSSCHKCGEGGHFARECMSYVKRKRKRSTTKKKKDKLERKSAPHDLGMNLKKNITNSEERGITTVRKSKNRGGWTMEHPGDSYRSKSKSKERDLRTPQKSKHRGGRTMEHPGDSSKSKSKSKERDLRTPQKSKHRGGWIVEHPGDSPKTRVGRSPWRSLSTPFYSNHEVSASTAGYILPNAQSSTVMQNSRLGTPLFPGSPARFQQKHSASSVGNSGRVPLFPGSPAPFQQRYSASRLGNSGALHGSSGGWHGNSGNRYGSSGSWHGNSGSWHGNSSIWYGSSSSAGMRRANSGAPHGSSGGWNGNSSSWYGNSSSGGTRRGYDWQ